MSRSWMRCNIFFAIIEISCRKLIVCPLYLYCPLIQNIGVSLLKILIAHLHHQLRCQKKWLDFDIILRHSVKNEHHDPLRIIVQGTSQTSKSCLIHSIFHALSNLMENGNSHFLLLAPIGIITFNMHAKIVQLALKIPMKDMWPLQGKSLEVFQEETWQYFIFWLMKWVS